MVVVVCKFLTYTMLRLLGEQSSININRVRTRWEIVENYGNLGCLPFTWQTRKFQLENQMVRIISFGVLLKLWASGQSDAFLLLLLGFTADVQTFCMLSIFC